MLDVKCARSEETRRKKKKHSDDETGNNVYLSTVHDRAHLTNSRQKIARFIAVVSLLISAGDGVIVSSQH
eukprot:scaffold318111_cov34-Prasinocladus_malaysianus.AAC.1